MGGELGYNWQIGWLVLGVETDIGGVTGGTSNASAGFINGTGSPPGVFFPVGLVSACREWAVWYCRGGESDGPPTTGSSSTEQAGLLIRAEPLGSIIPMVSFLPQALRPRATKARLGRG